MVGLRRLKIDHLFDLDVLQWALEGGGMRDNACMYSEWCRNVAWGEWKGAGIVKENAALDDANHRRRLIMRRVLAGVKERALAAKAEEAEKAEEEAAAKAAEEAAKHAKEKAERQAAIQEAKRAAAQAAAEKRAETRRRNAEKKLARAESHSDDGAADGDHLLAHNGRREGFYGRSERGGHGRDIRREAVKGRLGGLRVVNGWRCDGGDDDDARRRDSEGDGGGVHPELCGEGGGEAVGVKGLDGGSQREAHGHLSDRRRGGWRLARQRTVRVMSYTTMAADAPR